DSLVGKSVVITLLFLLAQPDPARGVVRIFRWYAQAVVLINRFAVGIAVAMGNPGSITGTKYWLDCSDHAARRHYHFYCLATLHVHVRLAIGDDKKAPIIQACAHVHGQSVGRPERFTRVPQAGFGLGRRARQGEAFGKGGDLPHQWTKEIKIGGVLGGGDRSEE